MEAANWPFVSATWVAGLAVVVDPDGGDLERTAASGWPVSSEPSARRSPAAAGKSLPADHPPLFAASSNPAGALTHGPAAFERIAWVIKDWDHAKTSLVDTETRRAAVLDELELTELATSIDGLSPVGRRGVPGRDRRLDRSTSARAAASTPAWHHGNAVRCFHRPRPPVRSRPTVAARRRVAGRGGCLQTNRVYAARYRHLTTRETNKLKPTQAQTAIAGAILRQLHYVITHRQAWDPAVAAHGIRALEVVAA